MLVEILHLLITSLMSVFLLIAILRFLLQVVRADFYNPVSQAIVKITMPLLKPMRRVIPSIMGVDTASIILILLVQLIATFLLALVFGHLAIFLNPLYPIVWGLLGALTMMSGIFFWSMIISIIGSFIAPHSSNPLLLLVNQIIDPLARPIRKLIPPLGGMIDLSPIFILLGLKVVDILLNRCAILIGVNPNLVLGYW